MTRDIGTVKSHESLEKPFRETGAPAAAARLRMEAIAEVVRSHGGIFIGPEELSRQGWMSSDADYPPLPENITPDFLQARHPLRHDAIGAHVLLALDPATRSWQCIETTLLPGSLGPDGRGLTAAEQDALIENVQAGGCRMDSPADCRSAKRIVDIAIQQLLNNGDMRPLPLSNGFGRVREITSRDPEHRALVGGSHKDHTHIGHFASGMRHSEVGLLVSWQ